jgi:hypothetical protein
MDEKAELKKMIANNNETLSLLKKRLERKGVKEPEKDIVYEMFKNACRLLEIETEERG